MLAGSTNWNANSGVKRLLQFSNSGPQFGPFTTRGVEDKYIGVRFAAAVPGGFDYGWIEFKGSSYGLNGTVYGWAYDNSGAAIYAGDTSSPPASPEPSSLALLAMGALTAAGAGVLRRWKKAA